MTFPTFLPLPKRGNFHLLFKSPLSNSSSLDREKWLISDFLQQTGSLASKAAPGPSGHRVQASTSVSLGEQSPSYLPGCWHVVSPVLDLWQWLPWVHFPPSPSPPRHLPDPHAHRKMQMPAWRWKPASAAALSSLLCSELDRRPPRRRLEGAGQGVNKPGVCGPFSVSGACTYYLPVRTQREKEGHFRTRTPGSILGQRLSAELSASLFCIKAHPVFTERLTRRALPWRGAMSINTLQRASKTA